MTFLNKGLLLTLLLFVGCLDIETLSIVREDGSVERQVTLTGSPTSIRTSSFNLPREDASLWQIQMDSVRDDKFIYQANRIFGDVDALNASFQLNSGPLRVHTEAAFRQKGGFFYHQFEYSERIWADLPGPDLDLGAYLTDQELDHLISWEDGAGMNERDSLKLEKMEEQMDRYLHQRIFLDFLSELRVGAHLAGESEAVETMITHDGDSLLSQLVLTNFYNENEVWELILEDYLPAETVRSIQNANQTGMTDFYERWSFFEDVLLTSYRFDIQMPGIVRSTTARDVIGNRVSTTVEGTRLFFGGFVLQAASARANIWSMVIAGVLFALTLGVSLMGFIRDRRQVPGLKP